MNLRQISVFLEDRTGRLAEITQILSNGGVNIHVISLADTHDFGILRIIVDQVDRALEILQREKFTVRETEVIAVEMPNEPGKLASFLSILSKEAVDIGYFYGFVESSRDTGILIFRFKDQEQAVQVIQTNGFSILSEEAFNTL